MDCGSLHCAPEQLEVNYLANKTLINPRQPVVKKWAGIILAISLIFVINVTLFPFDFALSRDESLIEIIQGFDWSLNELYILSDFPGNILLFLPFGFGVAGLAHGYQLSKLKGFGLALLSGITLSLSIEILQSITSSRFPTTVDVFANTLGAAGGAIVFYLFGPALLVKIESGTQKIFINVSSWRLLGLAFFWVILLTSVTILFRNSYQLENWVPQFPLLVGNEKDGERVWTGTISEILFLDRAISNHEVESFFSNDTHPDMNGMDVLANYQFNGEDALLDRSETLPGFNYRGNSPILIDQNGVQIGEGQWLETNAGPLIERIRQSSEFTLFVNLQAGNNDQGGPARIVSISSDAFNRNFTLGQEYDDLIIRIRSPITGPNGRYPELVIPGVFENSLEHQIVVSYQPKQIQAYIDSQENLYRFPLTPQTAIFWLLFPKTEQVHMVPFTSFALNTIFLGLLLVPLMLGFYSLFNHYSRGKGPINQISGIFRE